MDDALPVLHHRGPDAWGIVERGSVTLGHTRLAIVDLDERSDQPFVYGDVTISYNGELWNWQELRRTLTTVGCAFSTNSDTEVVAAALDYWGPAALERFEGMFAIAWTDDGLPGVVNLARDRFGETPLHVGRTPDGWAFGSEVKVLRALNARGGVAWVGPGEHWVLRPDGTAARRRWYELKLQRHEMSLEMSAEHLRMLIGLGAKERAMADVPVCAIISGGIDSSAFVYHLREHVPNLVTYCAVLEGHRSSDIRHAREVASALEVELRVVEVPVPTAEDLRTVISVIEMDSKAQVEIGWPSICLARAMADDGFKVTYSGEGADELYASYGFAYHALAAGADWHEYRRDLYLKQAQRNFPRANKAWLSAGVEVRLPYLHTDLAEFVLGLSREAVQEGRRVKAIAQEAYRGLLPDGVVNRQKVAFQDGMGLKATIADQIASPKAFYAAELKRQLGG